MGDSAVSHLGFILQSKNTSVSLHNSSVLFSVSKQDSYTSVV